MSDDDANGTGGIEHQPEVVISVALAEPLTPSTRLLKALNRTTGRSLGELQRAAESREPVVTVSLFGADHLAAAPRVLGTAELLVENGLAIEVYDRTDGAPERIDLPTLRQILGEAG
ncbi:hypothetical protein [Schumannella soli]|uniref:Uncharacterized protein n=1 Tax=Schumannella soli TaxID=2590779 RepID=A0A506XUP8_9MICO|nr:hypothetical protein [Schumannella soli]TPW76441.1 hypothetical protein FJ657_11790 [Schumannella soli]